jgi:uncharacterized membrane protein YoaK (UPF0700 family)
MFTKLPHWVEVGAFCLAAIAGCVNAIGLLGFEHQGISHLTGTSTLLGLSLASLKGAESLHLLLIIVSFVLGAALSGALIQGTALHLDRSYSFSLLMESLLLLAAMVVLQRGSNWGHFLASAACGLQNGMVSTYSGAAIRTTHVSGLFTDLGTMLGARLRGQAIDTRKALLFLLLIAGFVLGGSAGALAFAQWHFSALLMPSMAALLLAVMCWMHMRRSSEARR